MPLFEDRAVRYMTDLIRDFHFEAFQAAAIPGNAGTESGGFTKTQEENPTSGRGGLGDFQWTGPRRVQFEQWIARHSDQGWTSRTYEANYSMLFRDLIGSEKASVVALAKTSSLDEAVEVFMTTFERPGVPNLDDRKRWAAKALAAFNAAGIDVDALKNPPPPMPPASQIEVMPPQKDILGPLLNILLGAIKDHPEVIQQIAVPLIQQITSGKPGGGQSDLMSVLAPLLTGLLAGKATTPAPAPVPAPAPIVVTQAAPPSTVTRPSVQASVAAGIGAVLLQSFGVVAPPIGETATATGTLATVIPIASAIFGAVGGWQGIGQLALTALRLIPK